MGYGASLGPGAEVPPAQARVKLGGEPASPEQLEAFLQEDL